MSLNTLVVLSGTLIAVSVTDLRARVIPNRVLLAAAGLWLVMALWSGGEEVAGNLVAAILVSLPLLGAALLRPEGMGMGDVKLVALIGLFLGWLAWTALLIGLALAGLTGALIALGSRQSPSETSLPLAPFLAAGTLLAMVFAAFPLQ